MLFRVILSRSLIAATVLIFGSSAFFGQARIGAIQGVVKDPTGALIPDAKVTISQPVTGYSQTTQTDAQGSFKLVNLPFNNYKVRVEAAGFQPSEQEADLHSTVPLSLDVALVVEPTTAAVTISETGA